MIKKWLCPKCIKVRDSGSDCPECGASESEGMPLIEDYTGHYHILPKSPANFF